MNQWEAEFIKANSGLTTTNCLDSCINLVYQYNSTYSIKIIANMSALVKKCIVWTNLGQLRQWGCTCISRDHVNYLEMVKCSLIHIKHALAIAMFSGTKARHGRGHGHQACVCTRAYSTGGSNIRRRKDCMLAIC